MTRGGTILIIVAGICALLASLTLAFIIRTRASTEETALYEAEVQARIMLVAGCTYVCETSRIGYDTAWSPDPSASPDPARPNDPEHQEAFGWIDVRDGSEGPNTRYTPVRAISDGIAYQPQIGAYQQVKNLPNFNSGPDLDIPRYPSLFSPVLVERRHPSGPPVRPAWPAKGSVARCPMYVMERPPYAVELTSVYNPIVTDPANPLFGVPYLLKPDPQPIYHGIRAQFMAKDDRPRSDSVGRSWFRVYREPRLPAPALPSDGPAIFIITVGGGGTLGWRDYNEVLAADKDLVSQGKPTRFAAEFNNDLRFFETLRAQEIRMWFRIEWSPTVASSMDHNIRNAWIEGTGIDHFVSFPMNVSDTQKGPGRSQSHARNMCGTIRWVQRLLKEPSEW